MTTTTAPTATAPRRATGALSRLGVMAALAWVAAPATAQDLGLMMRIAQAQPGAAVVLAQLRLRPPAPVAATAPAPATRPAIPVAAQPALAVTAVAAAAARPPMLALR